MIARTLYAQGDMLLERVEDIEPAAPHTRAIPTDPDGAVVIGRGEVTGHRHAFHQGVTMFRDDALARDMPRELYVGHVKVADAGADLVHEEHATIRLPAGTYRVRRQREFDPHVVVRVVAD